MIRTKTALGLLVLAFAPLYAYAADLSGTWTAAFDTQMGPQKYTYQLTQKGSDITGTAKNDMGQTDLTGGKVDKDTVTFVEHLSVQGMDIDITYTGKVVSPNEIDFTRQVGQFATEQLVAKRADSKG